MDRRLRRSQAAAGLAALTLVVALVNLGIAQMRPVAGERSLVCRYKPSAEELAKWATEELQQKLAMNGGAFHQPLRLFVDFPGVQQPDLWQASEVELSDEASVVGLEVDGQYCAFVLDAMRDPARHIVNMVMNHQTVSVTYCDLVDCVRVLQSDSPSPVDLHVGGLDINQQMVFLLDGQRYGQSSPDLPLLDYPYVRTTWGQWKQQHPSTQVCRPSTQ
jgi:hypothetical protein